MKARRRTTRPLSERRLAVLRRLVPKSQMLGDLAREMGEKHAAVESHVRAASPEPSTLTCTDVDWLGWADGVPCQRAATHSSCDGVVCPAHRCRCSEPLPGPIPLSERCHYTLPDGRFCVGYRGHAGEHEAPSGGGVAAIFGRWPGDETDEEIFPAPGDDEPLVGTCLAGACVADG